MPAFGPISFIFMQFSAKILSNNSFWTEFRGQCPPQPFGVILDPPLLRGFLSLSGKPGKIIFCHPHLPRVPHSGRSKVSRCGGGIDPKGAVVPIYYLVKIPNNCMKMKKIGRGGCASKFFSI